VEGTADLELPGYGRHVATPANFHKALAMRGLLRMTLAVGLVLCAACGAPEETERAATRDASDHRPQVVATAVLSARVRDLTIDSPALGRTATVRLLLPAGFAAQRRSRWPVLYLLHGCCDTYESWTRSTDVEELTAHSGLLVVMPEGGRAGFYSDWLSGGSRWETFHLTELRRILHDDYRADTVMAIGGLSMGGLGALAYTARHPGLFRAAASFSGIVHTRLSPQESQGYLQLIRSEGEQPLALWGDPDSQADVWAAHNPYDLAAKLRGTPLFVSVGTGRPGPLDRPGTAFSDIESSLAAENAAFAERLHAPRISARLDFYGPGTHDWPYWQRELHRAWPMLQQALKIFR
jgi:diacylglycerol O-acyltransferase/trehalose O-mycolyltransferase